MDRRVRWGVFCSVLAIYVLTSPGRIDIIDGQHRYEVALRWVMEGRPVLRDQLLIDSGGVWGRGDEAYSFYGPAGSIAAMPLVMAGLAIDLNEWHYLEVSRFLFTLTSCILGALVGAVLYSFYRNLGLTPRKALNWTMINAFATLLWPLSTSSFDNAQQAFFALFGLFLAFLSAKQHSRGLATVGGVTAGVLLLYQEYYAIALPALAIATLDSSIFRVRRSSFQRDQIRESAIRYVLFGAGAALMLALALEYNHLRFGTWIEDGKSMVAAQAGFPLWGNPFGGLFVLLLSPGKSVFLYSPPVLIAGWGLRTLWKREPSVATAIVAATAVITLFVSCVGFPAGEWCWGPRYLITVLPLCAVAAPYAVSTASGTKRLIIGVVGLGVAVQLMAVAVETQRFFNALNLSDYFWADNPLFYAKHSALFSRPAEIVSMIRDGVPATARWFNSFHQDGMSTYTILGPFPGQSRAPWMTEHAVYYLPRPWSLWMWRLRPEMRPVNLVGLTTTFIGLAAFGLWTIARGVRHDEARTRAASCLEIQT